MNGLRLALAYSGVLGAKHRVLLPV